MKQYTLNKAGGGATSEIYAVNDADAIEQAQSLLGGAVVADQWDADGWDGDQPCKRILFWADEQSSENDAGANAIAQLMTIGNA